MRLAIHQFPYNDDNYGVLLHDAERGETALVDAGVTLKPRKPRWTRPDGR